MGDGKTCGDITLPRASTKNVQGSEGFFPEVHPIHIHYCVKKEKEMFPMGLPGYPVTTLHSVMDTHFYPSYTLHNPSKTIHKEL
jgi:hypothetical protein